MDYLGSDRPQSSFIINSTSLFEKRLLIGVNPLEQG
ncbi:hypothetical protein T05_13055 [Trichinella murrelli]|uniref:Uncharacterized protein n=1 Tax=Trichinella murrelli TaxID=144512 RepID=A0A0V0SRJ2_9BILA|nr:hypothetical protein T05_6514 [Trichinella murrelli]KRX30403.1 hypothetical protein T05_13055 [Trichinella murrelli]